MFNLPANLDTFSPEELAKITGFKQEQDGNGLPTLRVNYDDEDNDGNKIPRGEWTAYRQDGVRVFAPVAKFVPILSVYQYSHYDDEAQKLKAKSVYFKSFKDEVPDDNGGFKCGKVSKKEFEKLSTPEKEVQKKIKLAKVLFGNLTLEGVDQKGEAQKIEGMPCMFYARGSHFMPLTEFFEGLTVAPQEIQIEMALKRVKNGGVVYWEVVPSFNPDNRIPVTNETFELIRKFVDTISAENAEIMEKHKAIRAKGLSPQMAKVNDAIMNASDKLGFTDDEIPF